MVEQVQSQGPQRREAEAARNAVEVEWAAAESNVQLVTASESALRDEVAKLTRPARELGDQVARMREECDHKVKDVFLEHNSLQLRLDATASQLSSVCNLSNVACE